MKSDHDLQYDAVCKDFFDIPLVVKLFLLYLLPQGIKEKLDLSFFLDAGTEFIKEDASRQMCDLAWRTKFAATGYPVILMLEFQSTVDLEMPIRVASYTIAQIQKQYRIDKYNSNNTTKYVTEIIPIVIYTGQKTWTAADSIGDMYPPDTAVLSPFHLQNSFLFVDVHSIPEGDEEGAEDEKDQQSPDEITSLIAALLRKDFIVSPDKFLTRLKGLAEKLDEEPQYVDIGRVVVKIAPLLLKYIGTDVKELLFHSVNEVCKMIENAIPTWYDRVMDKGRDEVIGCMQSTLHAALDGKFGPLSEQEVKHINAISDYNRLSKMLVFAGTAPSVSAVFAVGA